MFEITWKNILFIIYIIFNCHLIRYHIQQRLGLIKLGMGQKEIGVGLSIINAGRTVWAGALYLASFVCFFFLLISVSYNIGES